MALSGDSSSLRHHFLAKFNSHADLAAITNKLPGIATNIINQLYMMQKYRVFGEGMGS